MILHVFRDGEWTYPCAWKKDTGYFNKSNGEKIENKYIYNVQDENNRTR